MALTKTEWADAITGLTVYPQIGTLFADATPILQAFGSPMPVSPADLQIQYSSGSVAASHDAAFAGGSTAGKINFTQTVPFGYINAPAQWDINSALQGAFRNANQQINLALSGIYDKAVYQICGGGDIATVNQLYGVDAWITDGGAQLGSLIGVGSSSGSKPSDHTFQRWIDYAQDKLLPSSGYNVVLTSPEGATQLRHEALGTLSSMNELAQKNFGTNVLTYGGAYIFPTRHVKAVNGVTSAYIINIGPEGVQPVTSAAVPPGAPAGVRGNMIYVMGGAEGKSTPGNLLSQWDLVMCYQILYQSPRAACKLINVPISVPS